MFYNKSSTRRSTQKRTFGFDLIFGKILQELTAKFINLVIDAILSIQLLLCDTKSGTTAKMFTATGSPVFDLKCPKFLRCPPLKNGKSGSAGQPN